MRTDQFSQDEKGLLAQADFEFKQRRFDTAAPLYEQVLEVLHQSTATTHADLAHTVEHLGDSLVYIGDYKKAYKTFRYLHELREKHPGTNNLDLLATKYRIGKVFEVQGLTPQAIAMYDEAGLMGEQSLYGGHPLLNAIYDALLKLLRETKADPAAIDQIQRKLNTVTAGNVVAGNLLESLNLKDYKTLVYTASPEEEPPKEPIKLPIALIRNVLLGIVAVGLIGGGIYYGVTSMEQKKATEKQMAVDDQYVGKSYQSADGGHTLKFLPGGKVDSVIDGVRREIPVTVLPPGSQFSSGGMLGGSRSFRETESGMLADDGRLLYSESAPDVKVIDRIKAVAEASQKYFQEHKQYPQSAKDLTDINPKLVDNPVTNQPDELVVVNAGKERDWTSESAPGVVSTLQKGILLPGEAAPAPGSIHCYYYLTGDRWAEGVKSLGFFVRACGTDGKFLPGHQSAKVFVAQLIGGKEPHIAGLITPVPVAKDDLIKAVKVIKYAPGAPTGAAKTEPAKAQPSAAVSDAQKSDASESAKTEVDSSTDAKNEPEGYLKLETKEPAAVERDGKPDAKAAEPQ